MKRKTFMKEGKLHKRTRELLQVRARNVTMQTIFEATGLEINWLTKFQSGAIKDPSVNRVEALYEFLTQKELKV